MIKERNADKMGETRQEMPTRWEQQDGEIRKSAGLSKSYKKSKILKSTDQKYGSNKAKWCDKCRRKHFGKCFEGVTCFK